MNHQMTKVEQAALQILCSQLARVQERDVVTGQELQELIDGAYELAYRFFDASKKYTREYGA